MLKSWCTSIFLLLKLSENGHEGYIEKKVVFQMLMHQLCNAVLLIKLVTL